MLGAFRMSSSHNDVFPHGVHNTGATWTDMVLPVRFGCVLSILAFALQQFHLPCSVLLTMFRREVAAVPKSARS